MRLQTQGILLACALMASTARGEVDGGFTLFADYKCPDALPMTRYAAEGANGWFATDARKRRLDCALAGAQGELDEWRPKKASAPQASPGFTLQPSHAVLSLITAIVTTYLAVVKGRAVRGCRGAANPFGNC